MKMEIVESANEVVKRINSFLSAKTREIEIRFSDGFFIKLKKHIKKGAGYLEIHTAGYDGTLPAQEAVEWAKWEIIDCAANGILTA